MANAKLYDVGDDSIMNDPTLESENSIEGYVISKTQEWEDFIESNFYSQWDEYYRLWRGIWAQEDSTRDTERSRIVTPALQQAVESSVSEIEEATFGHGQLFSLSDDKADPDPMDVEHLQNKLDEDFRKAKIRQACSEVLINAAVYGTGVAEIVLDEVTVQTPATEPIMDGQLQAIGVRTTERPMVKMKPIQMKNFRIDPVATSIDTAHGVAIEEFVPSHHVKQMQEQGIYKDCFVGTAAQDNDLEPNNELDTVPYEDKVRLLKYYGLVPRHMLRYAQGDEQMREDEDLADISDPLGDAIDEQSEKEEGESYWVEAIVVIANQGVLLKAEETPYMMKDRPIVAFQWDIVPGLFWGRGVCEKGYNSQKALDAEIRARIEALALTVHPMLAMDATRIPRGHTPQVRPGKMLLTNGNPREVITEFNFGNVNQITFQQAAELQKMVQQSTGAVDGAQIAAEMGSNNKTGAVSMSLGAIIKRQKRTLLNFQECFWLPFVEKAAWRYMQFDPENYPVKDYTFLVDSTLGIMGREYQVSQLVQLLQTTSDQSPMYGTIVQAIVDNMNLDNSEQLKAELKQSSQPNPEAEKKAQEAHQMQMRQQVAQISVFEAQANESNSRAKKYTVEAELEPRKVENERIDAVADVRDGVTEREFHRRLKIAETKLKEKDLNIREKDMDLKYKQQASESQASDQLAQLLGNGGD